jgi:hypothetical protein
LGSDRLSPKAMQIFVTGIDESFDRVTLNFLSFLRSA